MDKKRTKALVLLSGGLDSILAVKVLQEQGILVEAVVFVTNFVGSALARTAAKSLDVPLREVDIRQEFIEVLKKPKHGYGTALNPCIDCHALMLRRAGEIMRSEGFDLVATGEVLGERPMSQHKQSLNTVAKEANLVGYLLRPLSARLLEPTIAEKTGLIDREKLLSISGRNRQPQMALVRKYGIKSYPAPAGGCALTQDGFVTRLKVLMTQRPNFTPQEVDLVAIGRHFFAGERQTILGRNEAENQLLVNFAQSGDTVVEPDNFVGPTALIRGLHDEKNIQQAKELILEFLPKAKKLQAKEPAFNIIKK